MIDITTVIGLVGLTGTAGFGFLMGRKAQKSPRVEEDRCAGYRSEKNAYGEYAMKSDCKALRSPMCGDGRCSFHCQSMCHCDLSTGRDAHGKFTKK